jgi:hypothetical protein
MSTVTERAAGRFSENHHLVWVTAEGATLRWTAIFNSIEEWVRESMVPLHAKLSILWNRPGGT